MHHRSCSRVPPLLPLALLALAAGCGGGSDTSGPDPDPIPGDEAYVAVRVLLPAADRLLYEVPVDWTPDDSLLVYAGPPGSNIWKIPSRGGTPLAITDTSFNQWSVGSYTPGCLAGGRVAWFRGWTSGDLAMHVMVADTSAVLGRPAPAVLHRFASTDVGLTENQSSSPQTMSFSADGMRAAGLWRQPWLMEWSTADGGADVASLSPARLRDAADLHLSRDGARVAFVNGNGDVAWTTFDGAATTVVAAGTSPSWRGDGAAIGFVNASGDYAVRDLSSGRTAVYRHGDWTLNDAVLSWDGTRIAFLILADGRVGLAVGELVP